MKKKLYWGNVKPENQDDIYKDGRIPAFLWVVIMITIYVVGSLAIAKLAHLNKVSLFMSSEWALWFYPIQKMSWGVDLYNYLNTVAELSNFG